MLNQYQAVFVSLRAHEVKYLVIGGVAAMYHGSPRPTWDVDILIEATIENAARLLRALEEARIETAGLTTPENLLAHEITIFLDYVRIDVQTRTNGISFAEAWPRRKEVTFRDMPINFADVDDLLRSKIAAGRPKDLEDIRALRAIHENPTG
jgi:hypothetical protein